MFDIMFGTFSNPPQFVPQTGFYDGATDRVGSMVVGVDVSEQ